MARVTELGGQVLYEYHVQNGGFVRSKTDLSIDSMERIGLAFIQTEPHQKQETPTGYIVAAFQTAMKSGTSQHVLVYKEEEVIPNPRPKKGEPPNLVTRVYFHLYENNA
ncbi:hypothetical protein ACFL0V_00450 [Nanoarchaeota archaeon]